MSKYRFFINASGSTVPSVDKCTVGGVDYLSSVTFIRDIGATDPFGNNIFEFELDNSAVTGYSKSIVVSANRAFRGWATPAAAKTAGSNLQPLTTDSTLTVQPLEQFQHSFTVAAGVTITGITATVLDSSGGWDVGAAMFAALENIGHAPDGVLNIPPTTDVYRAVIWLAGGNVNNVTLQSINVTTSDGSAYQLTGYAPGTPSRSHTSGTTYSSITHLFKYRTRLYFVDYNRTESVKFGYTGVLPNSQTAVSPLGYSTVYSLEPWTSPDITINSSTGELTLGGAGYSTTTLRRAFVNAYNATDNMTVYYMYYINPVANLAPVANPTTLALASAMSTSTGILGSVASTMTDPDGDTLTFSIAGGAEAAFFTVNSTTGSLTFATPPTASGTHTVIVRATDTSGAFANLTVTIDVTVPPVIAGDTHNTLGSILQGDDTTVVTLPNLATGGVAPLTYVPVGANDNEFIMDEFGQRTAIPEITSGWKHLATYIEDANGLGGNTVNYMVYVVPKNQASTYRSGFMNNPGRLGDVFHRGLKQPERLQTHSLDYENNDVNGLTHTKDLLLLAVDAGLADNVNTWYWLGIHHLSVEVMRDAGVGVILGHSTTSMTLFAGDKEERTGQHRKDGTFEAISYFTIDIPVGAKVRIRWTHILPDNDSNNAAGTPNPYAYTNGTANNNSN